MLIEPLNGFAGGEIDDALFYGRCCAQRVEDLIAGACDLFLDNRPIGTCTGYQPPRAG